MSGQLRASHPLSQSPSCLWAPPPEDPRILTNTSVTRSSRDPPEAAKAKSVALLQPSVRAAVTREIEAVLDREVQQPE